MTVDPKKPVEYVVRGASRQTAMCVPISNGEQLLCAAWKDDEERSAHWGVFDRATGFPVAMLGDVSPTIVYDSQVVVRNVEKEQLPPVLQAMADLADRKAREPTAEQILSHLIGEFFSQSCSHCSNISIDHSTGVASTTGSLDLKKMAESIHVMVTARR